MSVALTSTVVSEVTAMKIAREIAMDLHDLETILKNNHVSVEEWSKLSNNQTFLTALKDAIAAWQSAGNTHERVKLKSAALVEEWLPEANSRAHDRNETLSSKVELMKLLTKLADMGMSGAGVEGGGGEKFSVVINLGGDSKLKFEKEVTPQVTQTIEGEVVESS